MTRQSRSTCVDFLLILAAIFLPPVAVAFKRGLCSADFLINLGLSCLGFIPGLIHAIYIVVKYPQANSSTSAENDPLLSA